MNIYDKLNELTQAIKESPEYRRYYAAAEKISQNETWQAMIKDFLSAQIQLSAMRFMGREPDDESIGNFNNLYASISAVREVNEFIMAQAAFSQVMTDITQAVSKAADTGFSFMDFDPSDMTFTQQ